MDSNSKTKQQEYDELISDMEKKYGKREIETFCRYAEMALPKKSVVESSTIHNSSVYGY